HRRYGHLSFSGLRTLASKGLVKGFDLDESSLPSPSCEACIQAKQAHRPFPAEASNRSNTAGERVMSDVWGPARVLAKGGYRYYISCTDD
ncbi:hypothetical protein EXIGLDRAFT_596948, partial [Exidia glandulosa HHB12029]